MITSKSPRKVLQLAYALGVEVLPKYFSPFSRHAFTKPQLFACLVLREHQNKSFRGIEALLADSMLDLMAKLARSRKLLRGDGLKPLTLDSSMFESRHVSRHFEQRKRDTAATAAAADAKRRTPRKKRADRGTRG